MSLFSSAVPFSVASDGCMDGLWPGPDDDSGIFSRSFDVDPCGRVIASRVVLVDFKFGEVLCTFDRPFRWGTVLSGGY